jgi:hypothetical protein
MGGGVYAHRCTHGGSPRPHLIVQCCCDRRKTFGAGPAQGESPKNKSEGDLSGFLLQNHGTCTQFQGSSDSGTRVEDNVTRRRCTCHDDENEKNERISVKIKLDRQLPPL